MTNGVFTADGVFFALPQIDDEPFLQIWRRKVFALLLDRGKITDTLVQQMLQWRHHSGFGVDRGVAIGAGDVKGLQRVAQYQRGRPGRLPRRAA